MSDIERMLRDARRAEEMIERARLLTETDRLRLELARLNSARDFLRQIRQSEATHVLQERALLQSAMGASDISLRSITEAMNPLAAMADSRHAFLSPYLSPAFRLTAQALMDPSSVAGILGRESALSAAVRSIQQAAQLGFPTGIDELLSLVEKGVEEALEVGPAGRTLGLFLRRHLVSILLALLAALHAQVLTHCSAAQQAEFEARVSRQLEHLQESIDIISESSGDEPSYGYYLVGRQAPLHQNPRAKATVVAWLQPGELVAVVERHGKWLHVAFVDPTHGHSLEGWVRKKYLQR